MEAPGSLSPQPRAVGELESKLAALAHRGPSSSPTTRGCSHRCGLDPHSGFEAIVSLMLAIVGLAIAILSADPHQVLEAIVDLGEDMGFLALARARRDNVQDHDQVIAVGFDRTGKPTWSRVVEDFRATEIYGGAVDSARPGIANFVVRVPVGGGEGRSALGWLDICAGVDGILLPRQLAGTEGWASAGFIEGREGPPVILTYRPTQTGIDWRILPLDTSYRVGAPR